MLIVTHHNFVVNIRQQQLAKIKWGHEAHIFRSCRCYAGLLVWGFLPYSKHNQGNSIICVLFSSVMYFVPRTILTDCISQLHFPSSIISYIEDRNSGITTQTLLNHAWASANSHKKNSSDSNSDEIPKVLCHTNTLYFLRLLYQFCDVGAVLVRCDTLLFCSPCLLGLLYCSCVSCA